MNELTINLHTASETPLYEQIYQHIKREIQEGRITSGEKLPSSRSLCKYLEVSRSTVELAYEQLISEGYVEAVPCKGYFAAELEGMYRLDVVPALVGAEEKTEKKEWKYNFTPNGVDLNSFPYNVWRRLAKDSLLDDRAEMFRLGDSQGEYGLRSAISRYLYQARGVNAHPDQIIIGAGNDYLLMLLSTVIGQNHKVALENPTYKQAYRLFKSLSYDVCTVDMDEKGMKVADLKSSGADIAFVMPSHQYPLGIVMPMKRRMELLKWAAKDPARYIIEDDYDSEFRYKGKPIPALQGYDRWEKVIYIGTFSKSIAPSIRVSYMVLPAPLHKVALENPTYKQAYRLFKSLSYDVCTVDMDEKGMKVADLKSSGADIAFVMPSHQYPLGIVMPMKRRMELLKWAAKDPARYIIEDDYDSEFRYKGKPIPALQGYDRWEKVIYIGTFSKSIAPSIRVSYMVLPAPLLKEFQKKSSFLSSTVSRVDQLILQKFIEDGHYERHLNRIRTLYKSRHDTLMGCLKTFQKICTISGENAGVHMLLHFAGDMTEEELIRKAAEKGVRVYGLSQYYIDPPDGLKPTIMLGYANISEDKMKEAVKLLEEAWK